MAEPIQDPKELQPDFSLSRDESIQELIDALPVLSTSDFLTAEVELNARDLKPVDSYETIFGTRALGALETDRKLDSAAAALLKPLSIWRDFLKATDGRDSTVLEYYFARLKLKTGKNIFALVIVRRNVIAKVLLSAVPEDLLRIVNGFQIFKNY